MGAEDIFGAGSWITSGIDPAAPKAYLNFILFDRDYVPVDMGFKQVSTAALASAGSAHERLALEIDIPVAGYLYVYVSNEHSKVVEGYPAGGFDDLKVIHQQSPLIQTTDYYAFGAVASTSWTRTTATPNPYLYNAGSELNDKTGWYETFYRPYDAYLGRFNGVDVMADSYSSMNPYQYGLNDPVYWSDPTGAYAWTQEDEENRHAAMDQASAAFDRADAFAQGRLGDDELFPKFGTTVWEGPSYEEVQTLHGLQAFYGAENVRINQDGFSVTRPTLDRLSEADVKFQLEMGATRLTYYSPGTILTDFVSFSSISNYYQGKSLKKNRESSFTSGKGFGIEYSEGLDMALTYAGAQAGLFESGAAIGTFQSLKTISYSTAKTALRVTKGAGAAGIVLGGAVAVHEIGSGRDNTHTWVDLGVTALAVGVTVVVGTAALPAVAVVGLGYGIFSAAGGSDWIDNNWGYRDPVTGKIN